MARETNACYWGSGMGICSFWIDDRACCFAMTSRATSSFSPGFGRRSFLNWDVDSETVVRHACRARHAVLLSGASQAHLGGKALIWPAEAMQKLVEEGVRVAGA